jgi:hypothetical protein
MSGALLAVALVLAGVQTQELVQTIEKFAQGDLSRDSFVHRWFGRALGGLAGQVAGKVLNLTVKHGSASDATDNSGDAAKASPADDDDNSDDAADADADDKRGSDFHVNLRVSADKNGNVVVAPLAPKAPLAPPAPLAPLAIKAPVAPGQARPSSASSRSSSGSGDSTTLDEGGRITISENMRGVATVELLHNIASAAGWSLTLDGVGKDKIDINFDDLEPTEALRQVLLKANCMGVLRGDRLVVIAADPGGKGHMAGLLVEKSGEDNDRGRSRQSHRSADLVKVGGDLVVPAGTVVKGDAVAVLGSVEVEPGAVVQGNVAAIGGNVTVQQGAVVMEDSVAILGENVERGGKVLGDHVQVDIGPIFSRSTARHRSFVSRLGPFGLFPTLALFAIVYLIGLLALRVSPERMRTVGATLVGSPVRSFVIGFLTWLLFFPVLVLLAVSVVGILLIPLLPLAVGVSVMVGGCALALRIGEALPASEGQRFVPPAALAMGLTAMLLVSFVPWIGAPLLMLVLFVAPGAVISSRFGRSLPAA